MEILNTPTRAFSFIPVTKAKKKQQNCECDSFSRNINPVCGDKLLFSQKKKNIMNDMYNVQGCNLTQGMRK